MKAKNEAAERFQALVADEIIPTIRRTGSYSVKEPQLSPSDCLKAAKIIAECSDARLPIVAEILHMGGIEIEVPEPTDALHNDGYTESERTALGEQAIALMANSDLGYMDLQNITGIGRAQLRRYMLRICKPIPRCSEKIIDAMEAYFGQQRIEAEVIG